MSQSSAVYQPTTVTYESNGPSDRWQNRPISFLTQAARRPCGLSCFPHNRNLTSIALIALCVAFFSLGLVLLIDGAMGYSDTTEDRESMYLAITIIGAIFFSLSILLFVLFTRLTRRICWRNAKDHMGSSGAQNLTVNPSTDFLVSAQYGPVTEIAEQSKLMPQDNKELINDDTDRMIESDPRIVLRPLNPSAQEET